MQRVLAIAPYSFLPYFSGGQKFIARFFHSLGKETNLTVLSVAENDLSLAKTYNILPILKKSFSRYVDLSLEKKITSIVKEGNFDTIIWEHPYFAWLAVRLKNKTGVKTIIHTHNIEFQRFRSMNKWWWPILKFYEKWSYKKADSIFFITPEDMDFAITTWKINKEKCIEIPFGIDTMEYPSDKQISGEIIRKLHGIPSADRIILFNGLLAYKPNLEALNTILNEINPFLLTQEKFTYKIIVCGKHLPAQLDNLRAYNNRNIIYAGFVENIETYFKGADLFLNPVQSGGGIKTKMVEAIGYGTTVISTETGALGIRTEVCGRKLIIVQDNNWSLFSKTIQNHVDDQEITPATFYDTYHWDRIIKKIPGLRNTSS